VPLGRIPNFPMHVGGTERGGNLRVRDPALVAALRFATSGTRRPAKLPGIVPRSSWRAGMKLLSRRKIWSCVLSFGYDGGMDANTKRPWYRLLIWVLIPFVVAVLLYLQSDRELWIRGPTTTRGGEGYGWPLVRARLANSTIHPVSKLKSLSELSINVLAVVATLAATVFFVWRAVRASDWRILRIDRQVAFLVVAGLLILLVRFYALPTPDLWRDDAEHLVVDPLGRLMRPTAGSELVVKPILFFSLGCILYSVICICRYCLARSRRHAPAKVDAAGSPTQ